MLTGLEPKRKESVLRRKVSFLAFGYKTVIEREHPSGARGNVAERRYIRYNFHVGDRKRLEESCLLSIYRANGRPSRPEHRPGAADSHAPGFMGLMGLGPDFKKIHWDRGFVYSSMRLRLVLLVVLVAGSTSCRDFTSEYSRERTKVYSDPRNYVSGRIVAITDSILYFQRDPRLPDTAIIWRAIDRVQLYNDGSMTGGAFLGLGVGLVLGGAIGASIPSSGFFSNHAGDGLLFGMIGGAFTGYTLSSWDNTVVIRQPSDLRKLAKYVGP
jgi:hypothetical protein